MESGLYFNEDYGDVSDVTRMLYLASDMPAFAADQKLEGPVGEVFNYSSGTSVLLSRVWQDTFNAPQDALAWPYEALFGPLGMDTAVFETDPRGTYAGSSNLYASARDWAKFGQLLLQDGVWKGERILPEGGYGGCAPPPRLRAASMAGRPGCTAPAPTRRAACRKTRLQPTARRILDARP